MIDREAEVGFVKERANTLVGKSSSFLMILIPITGADLVILGPKAIKRMISPNDIISNELRLCCNQLKLLVVALGTILKY